MAVDINDSFLTEEEQKILDNNTKLRIKIAEKMTESGIPEKVGEIRVLNEVLEKTDKSIYDRGNARLKASADETNNKMLDSVAKILNQPYAIPDTPASRSVPDATIPTDIVDGETSTEPIELDISDFIKE